MIRKVFVLYNLGACASGPSIRTSRMLVDACEHIQDIKCDAVNRQALIAYSKNEKYKDALECIERKCGLMFNVMRFLFYWQWNHFSLK